MRRQIREGLLKPDAYVPPEKELAKTYAISLRAVRDGMALLEVEGLIRRLQGRGTIVLGREQKTPHPANRKSVAVIFQGRVRDSSTAEEFDCLQQVFQSEGYGTTLYVADSSLEKEARIVEQLVAEHVPGLVLYSSHPSGSFAHLKAARAAGMKIVVYDHDFPELDCNFVGIDDQLAAYEAARHLIRLGCQELVFINSARDWTTHVLREQGFVDACRECAPKRPHRVLRLPNRETPEQLAETLQTDLTNLLPSLKRPLGVLVWWDEMALRAIEALREAGWSVPSDAAVVGFANDQSGELAPVPLTTMDIPREEIARLAAIALVDQMRDPNRHNQRIRLKARLIIRDSCGTYMCNRPASSDLADASASA
jgi:DNA-binding LacI/PurR family transcriptional regulator